MSVPQHGRISVYDGVAYRFSDYELDTKEFKGWGALLESYIRDKRKINRSLSVDEALDMMRDKVRTLEILWRVKNEYNR